MTKSVRDASEQALLDKTWAMLAHHAKGTDTPQDTLLRLFAKHLNNRFGWVLSKALADGTLETRLEDWTTPQLAVLWRAHGRTAVAGPSDAPIIVLRIDDLDFLIDGNTRVNKRAADGAAGTYPVIVLEAAEVGPGDRPR